MLPCGNGSPLLPHLLNQEKLKVQICEISRLTKFCSHFYQCWANQTKHTCGQHPVMTLIHYPVKGHREEASYLTKPVSQSRASLPQHLRTQAPAQCRCWLRCKGIEELKTKESKGTSAVCCLRQVILTLCLYLTEML